MPDTEPQVVLDDRYKESDDHVPDPTHQYGTLDTSGTAGAAHGRIEEVTPIFELAKAQDRITAARALDPEDDGVPESTVVLPTGPVLAAGDPDAARDRVRKTGQEARKAKIVLGGPTPAEAAAAESGDEHTRDTTGQTSDPGTGDERIPRTEQTKGSQGGSSQQGGAGTQTSPQTPQGGKSGGRSGTQKNPGE